MSDEKAAAHIQGIYFIVGTAIGALLGGGGVGALWIKHEGEKPVAKSAPEPISVRPAILPNANSDSAAIIKPETKRAEPPVNAVIQAHAQESNYDASKAKEIAKPIPVPTAISLFEYDALLDGTEGSPVERIKAIDSYVGKTIDWIGYFDGLSGTYPKDDHQQFQISVWVGPSGKWGAYCNAPKSSAPTIGSLERGRPFKIHGVLTANRIIDAERLALVESAPVSMEEYLRLLEGDASLVSTSKQYMGKHIKWMGEVQSLETYPDDERNHYRLTLVSAVMPPVSGYVYCYLSAEAESRIEKFHKGSVAEITGVLVGRTDVKLTSINPVVK